MSWSPLYEVPAATTATNMSYTWRLVIAKAALAGVASAVKVRLQWISGSYTYTQAYIGLRATSGDPYDIDPSTMVQLKMGGNATITVSASGMVTDEVVLAVDGTRDVVLSFYSSAVQPYLPGAAPAGCATYNRAGDYASVADTSSFYSSAFGVFFFLGLDGLAGPPPRTALFSSLAQEYGDAARVKVGFEQRYGLVLESCLRQVYGDSSIAVAALVQQYSDSSLVQRGLVQAYGDTVSILRALDQRYHLMHLAVAGLDQPYAICGLPVVAGIDQPYDMRDRDLIAASLAQHYSLLRDSVVSGLQFSVLVGGVDITWYCSQITWTLSDDAYLIEGTITLHDQAVIRSIAVADAVEITWMGTTYHLFVASKRRSSRGISGEFGALDYSVDYLITVRSATAALMDPYALPITMDWSEIRLASTIAADIIGGLSDIITLDWQVEDWLQPGGTFFLTDEIPLEGLRKLAAIVGAELATSPDNHLQVVMPDQVSPDLWSSTAPARIISDNGQIFSDAESDKERTLYNVVTASNQSATDQSVRFETEDVSEMVKRVKGYRVPWADIALAHSGGSWVTIEDEGIRTEQITETVEIIDGAASASKPVYSQVAARWLQTQLGAITASEDGSLTTEVAGMSLAEITYTTKYHAWLGRDDRSEEVQFYEVQP